MNKIFSLFFLAFTLFWGINPSYSIVRDDFIEQILINKTTDEPKINDNYDYSYTDYVEIPLRITETITTSKRNKSFEGKELNFIVFEDIFYNKEKIIKRGTIVTARLELMTTRGFAGVPAEIFITDFKIPNLDEKGIVQPISKRGFSMTAWILPVKWALTPLPPLGSLTNVFVGFNTKLTPDETIILKYYPNY